MSEEKYNHFLLLHCAIRILSQNNLENYKTQVAEELLSSYVEGYPLIYDQSKVSYNVHNILHLADCARQFGYLDSFSAYKYKNYMPFLKKN